MNNQRASSKHLIALARSRDPGGRDALLNDLTDLFADDAATLTERERAQMMSILRKLLHEVEMEVRRALAERLAPDERAPRELVALLANDRIEIARPILLRSPILHDDDLLSIIEHRGREHALAIAMRPGLSEFVSDAVIETGDDEVVEQLLRNPKADISRRAMAYLVAESERVDRFREPLVRRADLPPDLATSMFWWVSAALRRTLIARLQRDSADIDDLLDATVAGLESEHHGAASIDKTAGDMVDGISKEQPITPSIAINFLRSGRINAFIIALSKHSGLSPLMVRQILFEAGGESLAVMCRGMGWQRGEFAQAFLQCRRAQGARVTAAALLESVMLFFDGLQIATAEKMVRQWRRKKAYTEAIDAIDGAVSPRRPQFAKS